jgi:hypothetical protein
MMMPNQPERPPAVNNPMKPEGGQEKDAIKQQLVQLLNQAKRMAQQNGIDWESVMAEVSGKGVSSDVPRPPAPSMGQPMMGG